MHFGLPIVLGLGLGECLFLFRSFLFLHRLSASESEELLSVLELIWRLEYFLLYLDRLGNLCVS